MSKTTRGLITGIMALVVAIMFSQAAFAATSAGVITATANVLEVCVVSATGDIAFGTYDPAANSDANGSLTFNCTKGTSYQIYITPATGLREMSDDVDTYGDGVDLLDFEVYTDVGRTLGNEWPSAAPGLAGTVSLANPNPVTQTVYGRIPLGSFVEVGNYTGTITATVEFNP